MSEETTPIEEVLKFIELYTVGKDDWLDKHKEVIAKLMLERDKAYREKYKHTKEDVIEAYLEGFKASAEGWNGEYPHEGSDNALITNKIEIEKYYNETFNK